MKSLWLSAVIILGGCSFASEFGPIQIAEISEHAHEVCKPHGGLVRIKIEAFSNSAKVAAYCKNPHTIYFHVKRDGI